MGYVFCSGHCFGCRKIFSFHPNLVPSIKVNERREPICQECVDKVNPIRIARGLPPIVPRPGAYEYADENSVNWDG